MTAYYNENDKFAAAWLRELIKANVIANGIVDERSIEDVTPGDLKAFTQCHFFAGIGVWSYALRLAGWPDNRPVWTGSCPCQPFSTSGRRRGFADQRHLWPAFHWLIRQCRPIVIFGEQVASPHGLAWLDLVQADLEGEGYTVGAVDSCAAGFGAPHIRQRLYWVANAQSSHGGLSILREESGENNPQFERRGSFDGMADAQSARVDGKHCNTTGASIATREESHVKLKQSCSTSSLADAEYNGHDRQKRITPKSNCNESQQWIFKRNSHADKLDDSISAGLQRFSRYERNGNKSGRHEQDKTRSITASSSTGRPGPVNGFWSNADWLRCRDDKWRSVESGSFPLVNGTTNRVGRLRGYGNAIVAPQAEEFIRAYLERQ